MDWEKIKELFHKALHDPRALDGVDADTRREVESLLNAHKEVPEEPVQEGPGTVGF